MTLRLNLVTINAICPLPQPIISATNCKIIYFNKPNQYILSFMYLDELNGQTTLLDKTVYGVENSSTFLECSPKSQRALTYWQYQRSADDRKQEVGTTSAHI